MVYLIDGTLSNGQRLCHVELADNEIGINGKKQYPDKERGSGECVAIPLWCDA